MQTVAERLGVDDFGDELARVGNYLVYPRRVIIQVLKSAFSQPHLFTPASEGMLPVDANPFLYKETADGTLATTSRIVIVDYGSEHLVRAEARPRIVVGRSGGRFMARGELGRRQPGWRGSGVDNYIDLFETAVTLRCVGKGKIESELLALAVGSVLTYFASEIRTKSRIQHIGDLSVGDTTMEKGEGAAEQYSTTVTLNIAQPIGWQKSAIEQTVLAELSACITEEF